MVGWCSVEQHTGLVLRERKLHGVQGLLCSLSVDTLQPELAIQIISVLRKAT